jgi:hypothetical protein
MYGGAPSLKNRPERKTFGMVMSELVQARCKPGGRRNVNDERTEEVCVEEWRGGTEQKSGREVESESLEEAEEDAEFAARNWANNHAKSRQREASATHVRYRVTRGLQ